MLHLAVTLCSFFPLSQGATALAVTLQDRALQTVNEKMFETPHLLGSFKQDHAYMVKQISQILICDQLLSGWWQKFPL